MRILLINPPARHTISSEIPDVVREGGKLPPLGLLSIAAVLRHTGHEVSFLDAGNSGLSAAKAAQQAVDFAADVVGVTATSYQMVDALQTLDAVGDRLPQALRLLGGPHAAVFPEQTARLPQVDAVFVGEAESALLEFCRHCNGDLPAVPPTGVLYMKDGKLIGGGECAKPMELNELPLPDRSLLDRSLYGDVAVGIGPLATVATSRGCPYACTFCSTPGLPVRLREPAAVADELAGLAADGYREAYFVDDTFNIDPRRTVALCEEIIRRKIDLRWTCRARLDQLTPDLLRLLKPAGCIRVQLGVEAATDEGMHVLGKKITPQQARDALTNLRRHEIPSAAYFLLGTPDQRSIADVRRTVEFAVEIDPDYAIFNVLVPYPKTALYADGIAKGILDERAWLAFAESPNADFRPPVWTEHLSTSQLYHELKRAYRRFYLRPRPVWRQVQRLNAHNFVALLRRAWQVAVR